MAEDVLPRSAARPVELATDSPSVIAVLRKRGSSSRSRKVVDEFSRQVKAGLSDDQHTFYPQIEQDFAAPAGSAS
jgi:hypothetical protein